MKLPQLQAQKKGAGAPRSANIDDLTANYLRTLLSSPVDVHLGAGGLSVVGLRALARTPHVAAIIRTRLNQIAEWCRVQDNQFSTGFRIRPVDRDMPLSRSVERDIRDATDLVLNGGGQWFPGGMEGVWRATMNDSLIGDAAYFEPIVDDGRPVAYVPVDPAGIRRWIPDVGDTPNRFDYDEKYAFVQYVDQEPRNYFKANELANCVRNPRSWNYIFGAGHPELEELISVVAWLIHALATNGANYMTGLHGNMMLVFKTRMKKGRFQAVERMVHAALSGVRQNRKTSLVQLDSTFDESIEPVELGKTSNADMQYSDWINFLVKTCCFPPGEVVTMADGSLRPIEAVEPGELVLSHSGRVRRVLNMQRRPHTEGLVVLTAGGRTVRATDEHPFLVARCRIDGHMKRQFDEPEWVTAADIVEGIDYLVVPKPKRDASRAHHEYIDLAAYVDHARVAVEDTTLRPKSNRATRIGRFIQLTPKNAYALGLYMAEGCGCRSGSNVQFSFGPGEEEYAAAATEFFSGLGITSKTTVYDNHINVVGGSVALSAAMRGLFGHKSGNLRIPEELRHARPEAQQAFLAGYIAGDGSCWADKATGRTVAVTISTASRTAADQVQHMLLQHGVYASVYKADRKSRGGKDKTVNGRVIHGGDLYDVRVNGDQLRKVAAWLTGPKGDKLRALIDHRDAESRYAMSNRSVEMPAYFLVPVSATWREEYTGDVYNMEVETEHTYCVGRFAVHNCALFGIDPSELGYVFGNEGVKNQQYANSPLDRIITSKERGLRPLVRHMGMWINTWLIKPYWPKIQLEFGGFDVQTAKEKDEADREAVERWLTPNEIRADRGRGPIEHPAADLPLNTLFQLEESVQPPPVVEFDSMSAWVNGTRAQPVPFQDAA